MNDLVYLTSKEAVTDSLNVADKFHKRHDRVVRRIEQIKTDCPQKWGECFRRTEYKDASGKVNVKYVMNRDGFTFLAMGFTGKTVAEWKWKYIDAFNAMEAIIREKTTQDWIETRRAGMITRREETDVIKQLVEYAKAQGSTHPDKLYVVYSRLANRAAGIEKRDNATVLQLNNLRMFEHIALCMIQEGMKIGNDYKQIYQDTKQRFETVQAMAFLQMAS